MDATNNRFYREKYVASEWTDIDLCRAELLKARNALAWISGFATQSAKDIRVTNDAARRAKSDLERIAEMSTRGYTE